MRSGQRLAPKIVDAIVEAKNEMPEWTHQQIADDLSRRFGIQINRSTVAKRLRGCENIAATGWAHDWGNE